MLKINMSPKELRSRRIALHLTTAALAAALGVPVATVDAWERGEAPMDDTLAIERRLDEIETRDRPSRTRS
ncbi:MAG TPA: helix-turn-helix domain-containing protein [Thermoanaerobaculia bacterium]